MEEMTMTMELPESRQGSKEAGEVQEENGKAAASMSSSSAAGLVQTNSLLALLGLTWLKIAADREKNIRASPEFLHNYPLILALTDNKVFRGFDHLTTVAYLIFVYIEVSYLKSDFRVVEIAFVGTFLFQHIMNLFSFSWIYFFDFFRFAEVMAISLSLMESLVLRLLGPPATFRFGRVLVLRIFRFCHDLMHSKSGSISCELRHLRLFARGLSSTYKTLLWLFALFFLLLFIFGFIATEFITYGVGFENYNWVDEYFGNVFLSMFTLFQISTLDEWSSIVRPLSQGLGYITGFFVVFISLSNWAFLSLVTGVLIDGAIQEAKDDKADFEKRRRELREEAGKMFWELLEEIEQQPGMVTKPDFDASRHHQMIRRQMDKIGVKQCDLIDMWNILDVGDGQIPLCQLQDTFMNWNTKPSTGDMMMFMKALSDTNEKVSAQNATVEKLESEIAELRSLLQAISQNQNQLLHAVKGTQRSFRDAVSKRQTQLALLDESAGGGFKNLTNG